MGAAARGGWRARAPWRVLDSFGRALRVACRYAAPRSVDELAEVLAAARTEGLAVAFRGAGRSYGDAALGGRGLVVDTSGIDRVLAWDPGSGVLAGEPGVTIETLWKSTLEDGFWPAVVPGTMRPTLAGCVAMNVHGKNNFKAGPFGEHVRRLELLTPRGERIRCGPAENPEVFHAAVGGLGLLGAVTRVEVALKPVESGRLAVEAAVARDLGEAFDRFEAYLGHADYAVGWIDCLATGRGLGRGIVHAARYLEAGEDPLARRTLRVAAQGLPGTILGVPKGQLWKLLRWFVNDPGMRLVNGARYWSGWLKHGATHYEGHAAFAFLLDYVPDWRLAYGPGGFIQYQVFVPDATARDCLRDVLELCQVHGLPSYLGVLKRHRPDRFLLSHAPDGWSLALDFKVTDGNRNRLWALTRLLTERVLEAGGRFYMAKDAVLAGGDLERAYGRAAIDAFLAIKRRLDPDGILVTDLGRRVLGLGEPAGP